MKYGKIFPRVGGALIDLLVVLLISACVIFIWSFLKSLTSREVYLTMDQKIELWRARGVLIGILIDAIYTIGMQASTFQATLGQKASDLIVVKSNGARCGIVALTVRYFVSLLSSVLLKLGYLVAVFTKRKQTLHDLFADTVVIEKTAEYIANKSKATQQAEFEQGQQSQAIFVAVLVGLLVLLLIL